MISVSKLQQNAKDNLLWFMSNVLPTIQKQYKPLWYQVAGQEYYHVVSPLDETFEFFA